jgi:hypothetical protein
MADPFETTEPAVQRDRWGRPVIIPPNGGKPVAYTRCTTFVGALEDTYALGRWQQRQVAIGLSQRPDLILAAAAHRDDKERLNEVCDQAHEAAASHAAATTGTALHRLAERLDRGETLDAIPPDYRADLDAYRQVTAELGHEHVEEMLVHDEMKVAGTPDRLVRWHGELVVFDIKTGSIEFGMGKISMQLAMYSRSVLYDPATGQRTDPGINQAKAIVCHLPAGQGTATLYSVDIAQGWAGVELARQVRAWRALKHLAHPLGIGQAQEPTVGELIDRASSVDQLVALWQVHKTTWTDELTAAASRRKNQLQAS